MCNIRKSILASATGTALQEKISQLYGIRARHPTCCPSIAAAAAADASIAKQGHNSCLYVENSKVSPSTTRQYNMYDKVHEMIPGEHITIHYAGA